MLRKIFIILAVLILLTGVGFLLFPPVSNFVGQKTAEAVTEKFDNAVENTVDSVTAEDGIRITTAQQAKEAGMVNDKGQPVDEEGDPVYFTLDLDRLYDDSVAYNQRLLTTPGKSETTDYERAVFDLKNYGIYEEIYCYVSIDEIGMRLPVYLGSDKFTLSSGAGHLYGTSLPVGGGDINCAIAGHTSYPGRIFFDKLRDLKEGSRVAITTWWDRKYYKVIDYKVVKPNENEDLVIRGGRQLLTLVTCIDNGHGSFDRYLVICERE